MKLRDQFVGVREASLASGLSVSAVRSWIDTGKVRLAADKNRESSHRKLDFYDVFRIALTGHLVRWCLPVSTAWEISTKAIDEFRFMGDHVDMDRPEHLVTATFGEAIVHVTRDEAGIERWRLIKHLPNGVKDLKFRTLEIDKFPIGLMVHLSPLFSRVVGRLVDDTEGDNG